MKMKRSLIIALASVMAVGGVALTPSLAFAYKTKADCEAGEGAGKCDYCPQGKGDPGWHRCPSLATASGVISHSALVKLTASEDGKLANAKAKASTLKARAR
jgi:hypothetical protein